MGHKVDHLSYIKGLNHVVALLEYELEHIAAVDHETCYSIGQAIKLIEAEIEFVRAMAKQEDKK